MSAPRLQPSLEFLAHLVGNRTAFARQNTDGSWVPVRDVTPERFAATLRLHLAGETTLGTYVLDGDQARTLVFDIDSGDFDEVKAIMRALVSLGFERPEVGVEESGKKGHHVWVVLQSPLPAAVLRKVGHATLMEADIDCEVFPKQDEAKDLGNLVKLPGGVHRVTGNPNNFIEYVPQLVDPDKFQAIADMLPDVPLHARRVGGTNERFNCMTKVQQDGALEGQRNTQLFHLATMCRRFGLNDENTQDVVEKANARSPEPLSDREVETLLDSSQFSGPICSKLPSDIQCGEECVLNKEKGLHTRQNRVLYASEGEVVTVEVTSRDGEIVMFGHPDLDSATGYLRKGHQ